MFAIQSGAIIVQYIHLEIAYSDKTGCEKKKKKKKKKKRNRIAPAESTKGP